MIMSWGNLSEKCIIIWSAWAPVIREQDKFTEVPAIIQYDRQKGIFRRGCDEFSDKIREYPVDVVATPCGLGVNSYCQVYQ